MLGTTHKIIAGVSSYALKRFSYNIFDDLIGPADMIEESFL